MYLWDYSLDEVKKMTTSDELLTYYGELQIEDKKIIKVCSRNNLKSQIAKLNIVNVQLELCHIYMNFSELLDEDITIEEIETNYIRNVHERLRGIATTYDKESLRYIVC